jgi:Flp pilus assembly pilin Flp
VLYKWAAEGCVMINKFLKKTRFKKASGATLIEYVLIVAFIGVALVGGFKTIGNRYQNLYNGLYCNLSGV